MSSPNVNGFSRHAPYSMLPSGVRQHNRYMHPAHPAR